MRQHMQHTTCYCGFLGMSGGSIHYGYEATGYACWLILEELKSHERVVKKSKQGLGERDSGPLRRAWNNWRLKPWELCQISSSFQKCSSGSVLSSSVAMMDERR